MPEQVKKPEPGERSGSGKFTRDRVLKVLINFQQIKVEENKEHIFGLKEGL